MIRGILCALSTKCSTSLPMKSHPSKSGVQSFLPKPWVNQSRDNFSSVASSALGATTSQCIKNCAKCMILEAPRFSLQQVRTVTKFSLTKGMRKSVPAVTDRFFRLHWGIWIRTKAGRYKKLWKKSEAQRRRLLNHVFCNARQSRMLDKMVNKYWRKPKYYIEDPYEPYHKRENFSITRKKPWRPEGVDYE